MPQPESVRQAFSRVEPLITEIARYVRRTLGSYTRRNNYIFIDRTKDLNSLSEKLEGGRFPSWSKLDDLYGCTIVVPVASHESAVLEKLNSSFQMIEVRSRTSAKKSPDVFRFDGIRWYGRIPEHAAATRQPGIGDVTFEVQVITAFEYAWKTVTHDLVYKADDVDWRKERLAAQLKAAVEQIEMIIGAFESASSAILESPWPESSMKAEIVSRLSALFDEDLIPETLKPQSWSRFADNVMAVMRTFRGDPSRREEWLEQILDTIEADLRAPGHPPMPVSGTLFQYVLSIISRDDTPGNIARFTVIPSRELVDFYNLREVPQPFVFDGVAAITIPVEEEADMAADTEVVSPQGHSGQQVDQEPDGKSEGGAGDLGRHEGPGDGSVS